MNTTKLTKKQQLTVDNWIGTIEFWLDNGYDMEQAISKFGNSKSGGLRNMKVSSAIIDHFANGPCDCTL